MPDLRQLLAMEATQRQPASVPPFTKVRGRARRRLRNRILGSALAVGALLTACVLVTSVVVAPAYQLVSPNPGPTALRSFSSARLSFDYPASWTRSVWDWGRHGAVIVELSPRPLGNPCRTRSTATQETVTCGRPVPDLSIGQVYVNWALRNYPPGRTNPLDYSPGTATTIGGRPALVDNAPADTRCGNLDGGRVVDVVILLDDARFDSLSMTACLAAPTARSERQVMEMLASVSVR